MKFRYKTTSIISIVLILFLSNCQDLDVEYKNFPDMETTLGDPDDVYNLAKSGFYNYYMLSTSSYSPRLSMIVMADQGTCSWANRGMLELSSEPRMPFNNDVTNTRAYTFETYYQDLYSNLSQINDVLGLINNGMEIGDEGKDTEMIRANNYFIQGLSLGYLGLVYDKAYIMKEDTDLETAVTTSPYSDVIDAAVESLEKCIEISEANTFTIPGDWFSTADISNHNLANLAHSYASRFLVYKARTAAENELTNWQEVYDHSNNGIQTTLAPYMDNVKWENWFLYYLSSYTSEYVKIDLRIIHLMDPDYPWYYPADGVAPSPLASSADARLESDFNYLAVVDMKAERGYYHYSNYEYARIEYRHFIGVNTGEVTEFSIEENNLFKAEALVHLNKLPEAIDIINNGSRVNRGNLTPLPTDASKTDVLNAIFYERDIDLIGTGFGTAFFDMRRRDMLQIGTMLHFPIPGKELMIVDEDVYTFGGVANADGINTSNGGWFPNPIFY